MFSSIAYAMAPAGQGGGEAGAGAIMSSLMPIVLIIGVFYFLLIRPQQKKQKEHQAMLGSLKKGDPVVTSGGLYGRIVEIEGDKAVVDLGEHKVVAMRQALNLLADKDKSPIPLKKDKPSKKKDKEQAAEEPAEAPETKETEE